jgi:protein TonB
MRRKLLLSSGLHALAVAALMGMWAPDWPRAGAPARIEVVFGTAGAAPPHAASPAPLPRLPDKAGPGTATEPAPAQSGAPDPGLRPERPDPTLIEARGVASNRGPEYPASAWQLRQQGTVLLRLYIGADGTVIRVETRRSSGVAALDAAAIAALSAWRFLPAEQAGQPVASYRDQPVSFVLQ